MGFKNIKLITFALVCLFSLNSILALGISSPYWDTRPLEMSPGETRDVEFSLTNKIDAETATAFVEIEKDAGIAEIIGKSEYTVLPGTTNTKIIMRVSIPEDASIGELYYLGFSVKSIPSEEGTVQMSISYDVDFPVVITEEPTKQIKDKKNITWIMLLIAGILAVLLIIIYSMKKKE